MMSRLERRLWEARAESRTVHGNFSLHNLDIFVDILAHVPLSRECPAAFILAMVIRINMHLTHVELKIDVFCQ